jgi:hypothetical protein
MNDGRSIRLPSAKFAQVREPGRNGLAVTRPPGVGLGDSNPPLSTKCQRARIGIAAQLTRTDLDIREGFLDTVPFLEQKLFLAKLEVQKVYTFRPSKERRPGVL